MTSLSFRLENIIFVSSCFQFMRTLWKSNKTPLLKYNGFYPHHSHILLTLWCVHLVIMVTILFVCLVMLTAWKTWWSLIGDMIWTLLSILSSWLYNGDFKFMMTSFCHYGDDQASRIMGKLEKSSYMTPPPSSSKPYSHTNVIFLKSGEDIMVCPSHDTPCEACCRAKQLVDKDSVGSGKSDPYAVLTVGATTHKWGMEKCRIVGTEGLYDCVIVELYDCRTVWLHNCRIVELYACRTVLL